MPILLYIAFDTPLERRISDAIKITQPLMRVPIGDANAPATGATSVGNTLDVLPEEVGLDNRA